MTQKIKLFINITILLITIIVIVVLFNVQYDVYKLSPNVCSVVLDTFPEEFVNKQGEGTNLENGYTYAKTDMRGNLILVLTNEQTNDWKNGDFGLQILSKLWEGKKDIGVEIKERDYDTTEPLLRLWNYYYKMALTSGLELSDDYTQVIANSGDDVFYFPWFVHMGVAMQVFEGVPSEEIHVEYIEYDEKGQIVKHAAWPDNADETGQIYYSSVYN